MSAAIQYHSVVLNAYASDGHTEQPGFIDAELKRLTSEGWEIIACTSDVGMALGVRLHLLLARKV